MITSPHRVIRILLLLSGLCLVPVPDIVAADEHRKSFTFLYVAMKDDPDYRPSRAYTGLVLRDRHRPLAGAEAAIREVRIIGRSVGLRFDLAGTELDADGDIGTDLETAIRANRASVLLLDLPLADFEKAARRFGQRDDLILFNIRHRDTGLRQSLCAPSVFHTIPSNRMLTDGLAQYLKSMGWLRALVLAGQGPEDAELADQFERSALRFGLTIEARRDFVLSNDPREREKNNLALLTGSARYDVIFLADHLGEFGRYLPYATYLARPVIGTEGLTASAWHWTWERYGAPQLNQRFDRKAKRRMQDEDWAAWAAVRSVVEAIVRSGATEGPAIRSMLVSDEFTFDTYKGVPASFRPWSHQLRQPVLMHTYNAVIARAPVDGFLHRDHVLDSLGIDVRESQCATQ